MEDSYILLQLFLVLWIAYATLGLLFAPKITHILTGDDAALQAENSSSRISSNGFSFISAIGLSRQVLAKYIQALEMQLQAAKTRMREMVGHTASGGSNVGNKTSINNDSGLNNSGIRDAPSPASGSVGGGSASRVLNHPSAEKYQSTGLTMTKAPVSVTSSPSHGLRNRSYVAESSSSNNNNNVSQLAGRRPSAVQMASTRAASPTHDTIVGGGAIPSSRAQGKNDIRISPTHQPGSMKNNNNNNNNNISNASATITAALSRSPSQQSGTSLIAVSSSSVNSSPHPPSVHHVVVSSSPNSVLNEDDIIQPLQQHVRSSSMSGSLMDN